MPCGEETFPQGLQGCFCAKCLAIKSHLAECVNIRSHPCKEEYVDLLLRCIFEQGGIKKKPVMAVLHYT